MSSNQLFGHRRLSSRQAGFTLVEIMVGMVIGLLASLAITQVFATFEGQKRGTMGSSDAQTNGSIALYSIERDVQRAGYGLPVFDTINPPLLCDPSPTVAATTPATIDIFPLSIVDGGTAAGASDTIQVRYGDTPMGGIAVQILNPTNATSTGIGVNFNQACNIVTVPPTPNVALISNGTACGTTTANIPAPTPNTQYIRLASVPAALGAGAYIACLGNWVQFQYAVNTVNGLPQLEMQRSDLPAPAAPVAPDIVNIQAQYGVSDTESSNVVTQWVNARGATWGPGIAVADRNRIKAIRVAVVARNGTIDKYNVVTSACSSTTAVPTTAAPMTGLCAWAPIAGSPAPVIDLSNDPNWAHYRYRVFETIIPLRNMIWSRNTLP